VQIKNNFPVFQMNTKVLHSFSNYYVLILFFIVVIDFFIMFDRLFYLEYLFKYVIL
jgi:hypothetical protein